MNKIWGKIKHDLKKNTLPNAETHKAQGLHRSR